MNIVAAAIDIKGRSTFINSCEIELVNNLQKKRKG